MKYLIVFFLLIISIYSCKESNHTQFQTNQIESSSKANVDNFDSLLTKTYDELINRGMEQFLKLRNYTKAFMYFQTAWVKDSNKVDANYWLGCVHSIDCEKTKTCNKSLYYLNKAINIDRNYRRALKQRAIILLKMHDAGGALFDLNEAIASDPKDTILFSFRYVAKSILKDKKGACEDLLKSIKLGSVNAKNEYNTSCMPKM